MSSFCRGSRVNSTNERRPKRRGMTGACASKHAAGFQDATAIVEVAATLPPPVRWPGLDASGRGAAFRIYPRRARGPRRPARRSVVWTCLRHRGRKEALARARVRLPFQHPNRLGSCSAPPTEGRVPERDVRRSDPLEAQVRKDREGQPQTMCL